MIFAGCIQIRFDHGGFWDGVRSGQICSYDFPGEIPPDFDYDPVGLSDLYSSHLEGVAMIKKELYEELIIHIDKEELARLLDLEPGFEVQNIEEQGKEFRLILSRKTNLSEKTPRREERKSFL